MVCKNRGIYGFLGPSWVLITYIICPPRNSPWDDDTVVGLSLPNLSQNSVFVGWGVEVLQRGSSRFFYALLLYRSVHPWEAGGFARPVSGRAGNFERMRFSSFDSAKVGNRSENRCNAMQTAI